MDLIISIDPKYSKEVLTLIRVGFGWSDMTDDEVMKALGAYLQQQVIDKAAAAQVAIDVEAAQIESRSILAQRMSVELK